MAERNLEREPLHDRVVLKFDSKEEAVEFVKKFWRAMPHNTTLTMPKEDDIDGWSETLTAGDRTSVRRGVLPSDKGKWLVSIMGNNQHLTREAESWLRVQGHESPT